MFRVFQTPRGFEARFDKRRPTPDHPNSSALGFRFPKVCRSLCARENSLRSASTKTVAWDHSESDLAWRSCLLFFLCSFGVRFGMGVLNNAFLGHC